MLPGQEPGAGGPGTSTGPSAAQAEKEAKYAGLQEIFDGDLEEIRELGSGTFGTVHYGKWRGTDVAIKRLKASVFSGGDDEDKTVSPAQRQLPWPSLIHALCVKLPCDSVFGQSFVFPVLPTCMQ